MFALFVTLCFLVLYTQINLEKIFLFFQQYTPSYLTVNKNDVILSHVLENSQKKALPPGTHRWEFKAANIKAVSASKRDDRSMFMYVHENSDDFNLTFPSSTHCNKFDFFLFYPFLSVLFVE